MLRKLWQVKGSGMKSLEEIDDGCHINESLR